MAATRLIHQGSKFRVERCRAELPAGGQREFDVIRHSGAAVVLPLLPGGRVVMIRNHRYSVGRELLELPAGTIDAPESPAACAGRELQEETGYRAGELRPLVSFYSTPGICDEIMHAFLATELVSGTVRHEPGELIAICPMEYEQVLAALADGVIADGKTIVTLLYYDRYVRIQG